MNVADHQIEVPVAVEVDEGRRSTTVEFVGLDWEGIDVEGCKAPACISIRQHSPVDISCDEIEVTIPVQVDEGWINSKPGVDPGKRIRGKRSKDTVSVAVGHNRVAAGADHHVEVEIAI